LRLQSLPSDAFEVIIVDDHSDDPATVAELHRHAVKPLFRVVRHHKNLGLNEARRTGVKAALGDFVVFVDGDDMMTRDGLELLRMEAHRTKADIVTSTFQRWLPRTKTLVDAVFFSKAFPSEVNARMSAMFRCERSFTMCGRLFRKVLLSDAVFDMPERVYHEDTITLPRIMCAAERLGHVNKTVYYYTENEASITSKFTGQHLNGCLLAFADWRRLVGFHDPSDELSEAIRFGVEKMSTTMIRRCQMAVNLTVPQKLEILDQILNELESSGVTRETAELPTIEALFGMKELQGNLSERDRVERWQQFFTDAEQQRQTDQTNTLSKERSISNVAIRLKDKVVFIAQVDYQVRNAAITARELRKLGYECVVLDNSGFVADGKRQFSKREQSIFWRTEHIRVENGPYGADWLATAKAVITYNDFNDDIREALEYRQLLGKPTICAIEGINDFLRIDFRRDDEDPYRFLPYRRCDTVFLAGRDDGRFFEDRATRVVGLPIVEKLKDKQPVFPRKPIAAVNVNFTYGALEDKRKDFLAAALSGIKRAGFDYRITKHPMESDPLRGLKVTKKTQYELIDEVTVFVSRFATGILEALASGKPAIYFNPHGERVDKFTKPMGAFEVAYTEAQLESALKKVEADVASGVDFRHRAREFLAEHTNFDPTGHSVAKQCALAIADVARQQSDHLSDLDDWLFDRLQETYPFDGAHGHLIFGEFERHHKAHLSDEDVIAGVLDDGGKVMVDVGANLGDSLDYFLGEGWTVHAFEPDPRCRNELKKIWPNHPRLIVNAEAVDATGGQDRSFYVSDESMGISGLSAFTDGHRELCKVQTTRLRDYYASANLKHVEFLKIDVEGFDKFVLDGFPWETDRPDVILAEFEDNKTVPLGYTVHDLAGTMASKGYTVYVSEWHPITRYGVTHDWRRFLKYDSQLTLEKAWGNLIGFKEDPGADFLRRKVRETLKFGVSVCSDVSGRTKAPPNSSMRVRTPFYAGFANRLRRKSPTAFRVLQLLRRFVVGASR
jgi:FkbM family methyltransferase